jgi:kynurenine aminotransferase
MNFGPPQWVVNAAQEALNIPAINQYAHPKGRMRLREAIKKVYAPRLGRELDVETEILVSSGANEGTIVLADRTFFSKRKFRPIFRLHCFP